MEPLDPDAVPPAAEGNHYCVRDVVQRRQLVLQNEMDQTEKLVIGTLAHSVHCVDIFVEFGQFLQSKQAIQSF